MARPSAASRVSVSVLGATGSVGRQALDVLAAEPERFQLEAVTARRRAGELAQLAVRHGARFAAVSDEAAGPALAEALAAESLAAGKGEQIAWGAGPEAVLEAAARPAGRVVAAMAGMDGLGPVLAALARGADVAVANKEPLAVAGELVMRTAREAGARVLPVDSEHNALFQLLEGLDPARAARVRRLWLTATGGPFLHWPLERLAGASPEEACRHPVWKMGAKISVDSASLMNKGLELIEAHHLFGLPGESLGVRIHPQAVVHGMVACEDGAVFAHLSRPDMRLPVAQALFWPEPPPPAEPLDLEALEGLTFLAPDEERFPALRLARWALADGGSLPAVLSIANEAAVEAFLAGAAGFLDIPRLAQSAMEGAARRSLPAPASLEEVLRLEGEVRGRVQEALSGRGGGSTGADAGRAA